MYTNFTHMTTLFVHKDVQQSKDMHVISGYKRRNAKNLRHFKSSLSTKCIEDNYNYYILESTLPPHIMFIHMSALPIFLYQKKILNDNSKMQKCNMITEGKNREYVDCVRI